ncbi:MAG TPA: 3-deoxy-7-phosphoheptulonate synthase [Armatimonadota bacterium]|jgi:3-deoxy-7-phosphoheptulonate synthase
MVIILRNGSTPEQEAEVKGFLEDHGYAVHFSQGVEKTIMGAVGAPADQDKTLLRDQLIGLPQVDDVVIVSKPYKLVNRDFHPTKTVIDVGGVKIGGNQVVVMAGPCTVESPEMLFETARMVKEAGAHILRGGAYKPSTSPYSFHGMGEEGLRLLKEAKEQTGLPIITEVMDTRDVELVGQYTDIFQVGTRNMANFALLREIGNTRIPAMLKRGMSSTIEEWLQAAEYIASRGNYNIILCERGIRTFEPAYRNVLDVNAIAEVQLRSHLPVCGDASHGTGRWQLVASSTKAALAAGADCLMIETHPNPKTALKDGAQSLTFSDFRRLMGELKPLAEALGRTL